MSSVSYDEAKQQFSTLVEGHRAVLDYTLADQVMSITHTKVPKEIGGRGVAAELMRAALGLARQRRWRVNPVCSYATDYLSKHPEETGKQHLEDLLDEALDESYPASDSPSVGGTT